VLALGEQRLLEKPSTLARSATSLTAFDAADELKGPAHALLDRRLHADRRRQRRHRGLRLPPDVAKQKPADSGEDDERTSLHAENGRFRCSGA